MSRYGWLFVALALAPVGCDSPTPTNDVKEDGQAASKKKRSKTAEPKAAAKPTAKATAAATAEAKPEAEPEAQTCGPPSQIPKIPSGRSAPPTVEEWKSACEVNTQGANSWGQDCSSHIKREWLKVTCKNNMTGIENMEAFGAKGSDYFEMIQLPGMVSYVVRLRKGHSQKVRMCRKDQRASLFVSWPGSKEQPTIVAVGRGPKCDSR